MPNTFYLDYLNGNDANSGADWAHPWKTISLGATAARTAPGDTIRIAKSPDPVDTGLSCTFNHLGNIDIPAGTCLDISDCESAWTQGTNVTASNDTTYETEGTKCLKMITGAVAGAQKLAYIALGGTINFSSYQKVNFSFRSTAAVAAGLLTIRLCSDASGATPVNTIAVPVMTKINHSGRISVDTGGALGSSIQSVAIYCTGAFASKTVYFDNIFASKADGATSLDFYDVVSLSGEDIWYAIGYISGNVLSPLQSCSSTGGTDWRGYVYGGADGSSPTGNLVKRDTIKLTETALTMDTKEAGTAGNLITYEGGYNTSINSVDGITWWMGFDETYNGSTQVYAQYNYQCFKNFGFACWSSGFKTNGSYSVFENIYSAAQYGAGIIPTNQPLTGNTYKIVAATGGIIGFYGDAYYGPISDHVIEIDYIISAKNYGALTLDGWTNTVVRAYKGSTIYLLNALNYGLWTNYQRNYTTGITFEDPVVCKYNGDGGVSIGNGDYIFKQKVTVDNCTSATKYNFRVGRSSVVSGTVFVKELESNNGTYGLYTDASPSGGDVFIGKYTSTGNNYSTYAFGDVNIKDASIAEANVLLAYTYGNGGRVFSHDHGGTPGDHRIYYMFGLAKTETTGGHIWSIAPTNSTYVNGGTALKFPLGKFKCANGVSKTITVTCERTNTGIEAMLYCPANQLGGISNDLTDSITAAANTPEILSVNFTPTEDGFVNLWLYVWGGTTHTVYINDINGDTENLCQWAHPLAMPSGGAAATEHSYVWS